MVKKVSNSPTSISRVSDAGYSDNHNVTTLYPYQLAIWIVSTDLIDNGIHYRGFIFIGILRRSHLRHELLFRLHNLYPINKLGFEEPVTVTPYK